MIPDDPQSQAALIVATGRLIRNRTLQLQSNGSRRTGRPRLPLGELSMAQALAMMAVKDHEPLPVTRLAELLAVSAPSASAMVERLVERGVFTRESDPKDRRRVMVCLSPEAKTACDRIHNVILDDFVSLVQRIGPDMARQWCEVMLAVRKAMFPQTPPSDIPAA